MPVCGCNKWQDNREYGIGFSESIVVTETGCERLSKLRREVIIKAWSIVAPLRDTRWRCPDPNTQSRTYRVYPNIE